MATIEVIKLLGEPTETKSHKGGASFCVQGFFVQSLIQGVVTAFIPGALGSRIRGKKMGDCLMLTGTLNIKPYINKQKKADYRVYFHCTHIQEADCSEERMEQMVLSKQTEE